MPAVTAATPTPYKGRGFDRWAPLPSWSLSSQGERMPPPLLTPCCFSLVSSRSGGWASVPGRGLWLLDGKPGPRSCLDISFLHGGPEMSVTF